MGAGGGRFGGARRMSPVALGPGRRGPHGGGGSPLARRAGVQGGRPLSRPPVFGGLGGGVHYPGGCRGWLDGPSLGSPHGRQRGVACPSLRRARPELFGVPGRRTRPGGLAACGSVPAVMPARVPCGWPGGGGRGTGGWAPALGVDACRGSFPGRWPALPFRPPPGHWPPGCHLGLRTRSPCSPRRRCRVVPHCFGGGDGTGGRLRRRPRSAVSGQWSAHQLHSSPRASVCPAPLARADRPLRFRIGFTN